MEEDSEGRTFIRVGITALRDPATGDYLPAVPLYIENTNGAAEAETAAMVDVSKVFAARMRTYIKSNGRIATGKEKHK
ncbi:hypothetical protein FACS18948_6430 [Clostridia bacterium]|nr:hypothetical protein FACS18948_6430 [Clostridia bacterium]